MSTKREAIARLLRQDIQEFAPGTALPSEHELAKQYGAARSTVHNALAALIAEGLISSNGQGLGYRVRDLVSITYDPQTTNTHGEGELVRERVHVEFASEDQAEALGVAVGEEIVIRERVVSIAGEPVQLVVSMLPREITRGTAIEAEDVGPGGVMARLDELGHKVAACVERVRVHRLSEEEALALAAPQRSAALRVVRTSSSAASRVLEVTIRTLVDRYELAYEVPA